MIFIVPIILGGAALITGGLGVKAGIDGVSNMEKAKKIGKDAQARYEKKCKLVQTTSQQTQNLAEEYGQLQIQVQLQTIKRFVSFLERIRQRASLSELKFLEELPEFSLKQIEEYKITTLQVEHLVTGGMKSVGAAYAVAQGTIGLVGLFGTASTGTAISGLSGAAAWNATLAWLGGGSLAAGGGGMALGTMVLTGIAAGPALMIGGFVLGGQGEKALTKARDYEAQTNIAIAKLDASQDFLGQVQRRITELMAVVNTLNNQAIEGLVALESKVFLRSGLLLKESEELDLELVDFRVERDAAQFQQVGLLIKSLSDIFKTPVLDAEGNLN